MTHRHEFRDQMASVQGRATDLSRLLEIRNGEPSAILEAFRHRWVSPDATFTGSTSGRDESIRNILVEPEIGPIIDTRINETPTAFQYVPSDGGDAESQRLSDLLNEWSSIPANSLGEDFLTAFDSVRCDQEEHGLSAVVFGTKEDGQVWFEVRDTRQMPPAEFDPERPGEITRAQFIWQALETIDGETGRVTYLEEFTPQARRIFRDGVELEDRRSAMPGFVPVVLFPRMPMRNGEFPTSGIQALVEPLLNYLWSLHLLNVANKYEAHGVYCPEPSVDDGSLLPDQDGGRLASISLYPGALVPYPIRKVGGSINTQSMQAQVEGRLRALRRAGYVRERGEEDGDHRSGKSMLVGNEQMRAYIRRKLVQLRLGLRKAGTFCLRLKGEIGMDEEAPVMVEIGDTQDEDKAEATKRAEFALKARAAGELTRPQYFGILVRNGIFEEDMDAEELASAVDSEEEEAAEAAATKMLEEAEQARQQARPPALGEEQHEEQQPPPNGGGSPVGVVSDG